MRNQVWLPALLLGALLLGGCTIAGQKSTAAREMRTWLDGPWATVEAKLGQVVQTAVEQRDQLIETGARMGELEAATQELADIRGDLSALTPPPAGLRLVALAHQLTDSLGLLMAQDLRDLAAGRPKDTLWNERARSVELYLDAMIQEMYQVAPAPAGQPVAAGS